MGFFIRDKAGFILFFLQISVWVDKGHVLSSQIEETSEKNVDLYRSRRLFSTFSALWVRYGATQLRRIINTLVHLYPPTACISAGMMTILGSPQAGPVQTLDCIVFVDFPVCIGTGPKGVNINSRFIKVRTLVLLVALPECKACQGGRPIIRRHSHYRYFSAALPTWGQNTWS